LNYPKDKKYALSVDGDSDRIIFYTYKQENDEFKIIDGDKIIILKALVIHKILYEVFKLDPEFIKLALIINQYSNHGMKDVLK